MDTKKIIDICGLKNYISGKKIDDSDCQLVKNYPYNNNFNNSYYNCLGYEVVIREKDGKPLSSYCECINYNFDTCCEHVAKVLLNYTESDNKEEEIIEDVSMLIAKSFLNNTKKEYWNVELDFDLTKGITIKPKIGPDKTYSIKAKFRSLVEHYKHNLAFSVPLTKKITFSNKVNDFKGKNKEIIDYLIDLYETRKEYYVSDLKALDINNREFENLIKLLDNKNFTINKNLICKGIKVENPYDIQIYKENNKYKFKINFDSAQNLSSDFSYAYKNGLYKLPDDIKKLCYLLDNNGIDELTLDDKTAISLSKKLYTNIKDNLIIDDELSEEIIIKEPKVKLLIDLTDNIVCKIMLDYGEDKKVNYFEKLQIYRNEKYEEDLVNELLTFNFNIEKKKFLIKDIDQMVNFMEKGIFELSEKFEVLTTKKFQNSNVVSPSIKSSFTIGKDNIMKFDFDLGDISNDELKKVFDNMKDKKKYYKLKNGNILNIENESLKQLNDVYDNLDIDYNEGNGIIPKYRALYLDSIKEYDFISTNSLFDNFIDNFNKYKDLDIEFSKNDDEILRDYQKTGVKWLYNIYKCDLGGILADEMGLGKTLQTIVFLKQIIKENKDFKILIVSPTSLIYNWAAEFDKFGGDLKYKVVANSKNKRKKIIEEDCNIFITSYGLLRQDEEMYENINFEVTIIDEGQNIKNPQAGISRALKKIKSNVKIALTGTPVENSVLEVWSIFDFIMPGYLSNLNKFQSRYNIKNNDDMTEKLSNLSNMIAPFILRRTKKDVLLNLPDKINNDIYLDLLPKQKKIYAATVKESKERFDELIKKDGFMKVKFEILTLLTKLRQICIDPSIVYENCENESIKMNEIVKLLNGYVQNNHKVLVFSSFKTGLNILREKLSENGISNYMIDGTVSATKRNELVNSFNKDNTNAFLIMLKAGGVGLNLTSADVVIHLDLWWNPQAENQATDRAHRIGQTNTVEVVRLICKGTIEEKIVSLQEKKRLLSDNLIDNKNDINISSLTEKDIKDLLSFND